MQAQRGSTPARVEVFYLRFTAKHDKSRGKFLDLRFSVKLDGELALVCDEKIQRAFEDCTHLEREIERVQLKTQIANTDIEFYLLPRDRNPHAEPVFKLSNVRIEALMCERDQGQTYLYFAVEALLDTSGLGAFAYRYHSALFCEFAASQHALDWDAPPLARDEESALADSTERMEQIATDFVAAQPNDTTLTISSGDQSVTITPEDIKRAKAKKRQQGGTQ